MLNLCQTKTLTLESNIDFVELHAVCDFVLRFPLGDSNNKFGKPSFEPQDPVLFDALPSYSCWHNLASVEVFHKHDASLQEWVVFVWELPSICSSIVKYL